MPDFRSDPRLKDFLIDIGTGLYEQQDKAAQNLLFRGTRALINSKLFSDATKTKWATEVADIDSLIGGFNNLTMKTFTDQALTPPPTYNASLKDGFLKYGKLALFYARKYKLSPLMVLSQIQHESQWNPRSVSPSGAQGLMQLMPATVTDLNKRGIKVTDAFDAAQNLDGGCFWDVWGYTYTVKNNVIETADSAEYTLATFNGGIGTVQRAIQMARQAHNMGRNVPMPYNLTVPYYKLLPNGGEVEAYVKGILRDTDSYVSFVTANP